MSQTPRRKLSKPAKEHMRSVRKIHMVCAALFFIAGLCVITFPALARDFGLDDYAIKVVGGSLMLAGVMDVLLMRFVFKDLDRL